MKISVIMASYLTPYQHSATNLEHKFKRAVESFMAQSYPDKELIIVADGCERTIILCSNYTFVENIKVIYITKQELFSGAVRNAGLGAATGSIIAYLDVDDIIGENHLLHIANGFNNHPEADWLYFDDHIIYRFNPQSKEILSKATRGVILERGIVGTSSIAHKNLPEYNWHNCNGYEHDWTFIQKLIDSKRPHYKVGGGEYYVCHIPQSVDS